MHILCFATLCIAVSDVVANGLCCLMMMMMMMKSGRDYWDTAGSAQPELGS